MQYSQSGAASRPNVLLAALCLVLSACDAAPAPDAGALDAASCACDDGLFCNGVERCLDGDGGPTCAAGTSPCGPGTTCEEVTDRCMAAACDTDADGDGYIAMACGGDDCDDDDVRRNPGALEVCDEDHLDEDCDPSTVGDRDVDDDGAIDAACCNADRAELRCGDDCDDANPSVRRTAPEVCDGEDDDCDGAIDEGVSYALWPDADRDGFGDAAEAPIRECSFLPGYALVGDDCDDASSTTNPGVFDVCNGVDDDCDGAVDEGAEDLCAAADGVTVAACVQLAGEPTPRCVVSACAPELLDCDLDPSTGCEANFCDDLAHCGACGGYGGACSFGTCRDGRCFPDSLSLGVASGLVRRASDEAPIEGAEVSRVRECGGPRVATSNASGAYELTWDFDPPFVLVRTEATGYVTQVDGRSSWDDIRLLSSAELDAALAMSPVPVDRRLGVVVVDAPTSSFEVVEPIAGTYQAPSIPGTSYTVALPNGWTRTMFVNVRPGRARVRAAGAGDARTGASCNSVSPTYEGAWDAPIWHDTTVRSDAIVHLRFGWCRIIATGG